MTLNAETDPVARSFNELRRGMSPEQRRESQERTMAMSFACGPLNVYI